MMVDMRLVSLAACGLAWALVTLASAGAHIGVTPGLVVAGDTQTLSLSVHNDLDRPMTGLSLTAPSGVRIVRAGGAWQALVEDETATWTGGPLAPNTGGRFEIDLEVDESTPTGPVQLQAEQLYPGDGSLPWPISVTVIPRPANESSLDSLYIPGLALIGVLVLAAIAALAALKRRRGRSLQEQ